MDTAPKRIKVFTILGILFGWLRYGMFALGGVGIGIFIDKYLEKIMQLASRNAGKGLGNGIRNGLESQNIDTQQLAEGYVPGGIHGIYKSFLQHEGISLATLAALVIVGLAIGGLAQYLHEVLVGKVYGGVEQFQRMQTLRMFFSAEPTKLMYLLHAGSYAGGALSEAAASVGAGSSGSGGRPGNASGGSRNKNLDRDSDGVSGDADFNGRGKIIAQLGAGPAQVANFRAKFLIPALASFTSPFIIVLLMGMLVDWVVALTVLAFVLLVPLTIGLFMRKFRVSGRGFMQASTRVANLFLETFESLAMIRLVNGGGRRRKELLMAAEEMRREVMRMLRRNQIMIVVNDSLFAFAMVTTAAVFSLQRLYSGQMTLGQVVSVLFMTVLLHEPIDKIGRSFYVAMGGAAEERGLRELRRICMQANEEHQDNPVKAGITDKNRKTWQGEMIGIQAMHISVSRAGKRVLQDINFRIDAGEHLAVVGASGSGKTTLLLALAGQLAITDGKVKIYAAKSQADALVQAEDLRQLVALVSQNPFMFNGTLAQNLRIAREEASDAEIWRVLEKVQLAAEVREFADQLDTWVGENGVRLSGGQVRRLGIARALLKDSPIILLDEPTADLDQRTEALVMQAIAEVTAGRTVITVAHRFRAVADADRLMVLKSGTDFLQNAWKIEEISSVEIEQSKWREAVSWQTENSAIASERKSSEYRSENGK